MHPLLSLCRTFGHTSALIAVQVRLGRGFGHAEGRDRVFLCRAHGPQAAAGAVHTLRGSCRGISRAQRCPKHALPV